MFSRLSDKLQDVFKDLRGHGRISEQNVTDALREVRMALLEADVHFRVAKEFIARVKDKALGEDVLRSVTPGQQIVKIFHDELTSLLGGDAAPLNLGNPARILIVGLNGAGKTTSSAKLARWLKTQGKAPLLIACDLQRPAAIQQLATLGEQIDVRVFQPKPGEKDVLQVSRQAASWCEQEGGNVQIYDTAGRQEIDGPLVEELRQLKDTLAPQEVLLVCDAATGQQAVSVAEHFHSALGLTGIILQSSMATPAAELPSPCEKSPSNRSSLPAWAKKSTSSNPSIPSGSPAGFWAWGTSSAWSKRPPKRSPKRTPVAWKRRCAPHPSI